jgi:hypothetical protein
MLLKVLIGLVVVIAAVLVYAATRPDSFRIERSIAIKAPPQKIFALVNDFHGWAGWSPWDKMDPGMKRTYSGAAAGKGTIYAWEGNNKVGSGRMEILDSAPSQITIKLDFYQPFEGHNTAQFSFATAGDTTTVTWAMFGPSPFMARVMGLVFSMDDMVGGQFESGLANLKNLAEK